MSAEFLIALIVITVIFVVIFLFQRAYIAGMRDALREINRL